MFKAEGSWPEPFIACDACCCGEGIWMGWSGFKLWSSIEGWFCNGRSVITYPVPSFSIEDWIIFCRQKKLSLFLGRSWGYCVLKSFFYCWEFPSFLLTFFRPWKKKRAPLPAIYFEEKALLCRNHNWDSHKSWEMSYLCWKKNDFFFKGIQIPRSRPSPLLLWRNRIFIKDA